MQLGDSGHRMNPWSDICARCGQTRLQMMQQPKDAEVCRADAEPEASLAAFQREREFFDRLSR